MKILSTIISNLTIVVMNNYIYHGILNIHGKHIDATWTQGFSTIWVEDKVYNGYSDLLKDYK